MVLSSIYTMTLMVSSMFLLEVNGDYNGLIRKETCDKIGGVEIRYNEFYELYLGHNAETNELQTKGIVYRSLKGAVQACCPGLGMNFTVVNESAEYLVKKDILHQHKKQNQSHLVFYFPEFTAQGNLEVYSHRIPFLKLRKSPGFALVMLKSESHLDISAVDVIKPSWPIFALMLSLSWAVGIIGWALDHHFNSEEFPKPFYKGMFEGFWWAVITMSTVGYGDKAPKSIFARVLCVIWILAGAVLLALFTANTTSIITASRIEKNSQTMGKKIAVVNMKQFVEAELNLGAQIIEFARVESALAALMNKSIDRLLFPHYLDLLYIMSDPTLDRPLFSKLYIAKELDKSYQIGMVLSPNEASSQRNDDFYSCLEIMTSRISSEHNYDYSRIDDSIIDHSQNTFDRNATLKYFYAILVVVGCLVILGLAFDLLTWAKATGKMRPDSEKTKRDDSCNRPV